ncbi:hypothetical protein DFS34DRAFT_601958 [Phlyctochytrium arcticum]|nr:hypothetical protein DFS34DRAFT_601958 [Phlyctochytrium arcticum]
MVCNHPVGRESKRPRVISEKLSLKMPLPSPKKDDIVPIGNGIPMAFKKSKLRAHRPSKQANTTTSSPGTMGTDPSVGHREGSQSNSNTPSCHSSESLGAKETSSVASTDTGERPPLNLRDKRATERVLRKAPYQKHLNQLGATLKYALFKIQNGWEDKPLDEVKQCYAQRNPSRPGTSVSFHVENGRACIVGNPTPKHMYRPLAKIKGDELFLQREGRRSSDQDMAEAALALQFLSGGGSLPPSSLPSSGTVANTAGTSRRADGSSRKRPSEDTVTPQPPRKIRRNNIGVLTPTPTPTAKTTPQSTKFTKYVACAQQPSTPQSCSGMSTAIGNIKHTCFSYYSVSPSCRALTHEPFYAPPLPYAYTIPSLCQPSPVIKSTLPE